MRKNTVQFLLPILSIFLMLLSFLGYSQTGSEGGSVNIQKKQKEMSSSQGNIKVKKSTSNDKNQKNMGQSQGTMNAKQANASHSGGPKNNQATAEANKGTNVQKKQRQMGTSTGDMVVSNKTGVKPPLYDNSVVVDNTPSASNPSK